jgi:hypothetical protein
MDLDLLTNILIAACAVVFIAAIAYRTLSGAGPEGDEEEELAEEDLQGQEERAEETRPVVEEPPRQVAVDQPTIPQPTAPQPAGQSVAAFQLLDEVADEQKEAIRRSARALVDYSVARGGVSHVRPEVLVDLALQFGTLEAAIRTTSRSPTGEEVTLSEETKSQIFMEGFRRIASKARK